MSLLEHDHHDDDELDHLPWDDEDDFVSVRSGGLSILRAIVALVVLGVIGYVLYTGVRGWFEAQLDPEGEPGASLTLTIPSGATTGDIAEILEDNGVIPNSTFFRYYAQYEGEGNFQAGEYTMYENSSAAEAIEVLNAGPVPPVYNRFGVPEGLWVDEMLPRLASQLPNITEDELRTVLDSGQLSPRYRPDGVSSWEGMLFPAFYEIEDDAQAIDVLAKMSNEFARVTGELGYGAAETNLGISAYEVIIVASMVEAEAKTDADRPLIARVIYNRLQEQMSLDIDATCIYGSGERGFPLTREILDDYGSFFEPGYACRGYNQLPPTPIAAPGRASLQAAIEPAPIEKNEEGSEIRILYYVLKDREGNHLFTDNYDEFINQKNQSIAEGIFEN